MERIITESMDLTTRRIVRDIIKIVRSGDEGSWELPSDLNGENYYKDGLYVFFDWNMNWNETDQKYFVDGNYDDETETMAITLFINKNYYPQSLYDLIADLNDIIIHEYEHHYQNIGLRPDNEHFKGDHDDQPTDWTYYLQPHEIPAIMKGIKRVMKLRRISFEEAIDGWYERNMVDSIPKKDYDKLKKKLTELYFTIYGKK